MDEITEALGQLSTSAKEWKPGDAYGGNSQETEALPHNETGHQEPQLHETHALSHNDSAPKPYGDASVPKMHSLQSLGLSDELWRYYRDVALESRREMEPRDPKHNAIPPSFSNIFPLESGNGGVRSSFGYPTSVFKAMGRDGNLYCLRRLDNVRSVSYKIASAVTERWATARSANSGAAIVDHPGVVRLYRCFLSNRAVFFLHQYIPGARTLRERFFDRSSGGGVALPEPLIWSCITQLAAAIRCVHAGNLACRTLHLNHILCVPSGGGWGEGRLRLKINCLGVVDALEFEARKILSELQMEDMRDLGYIILSLSTGSESHRSSTNMQTLRRYDAFLAQNYSRELHALAVSLVSMAAHPPSIHEVSRVIAGRAFEELDASHTTCDHLDSSLAAEYESGRALRLLLKLGFVNERPEFGMNRRWSESGDCYVLKLFRDYVFHQADGGGRPVMDLGHVVTTLNKLEASDEEKIVLSSRDGKSLLVVSFADVARCLDSAYNELCMGSVPAKVEGPAGPGF